MNSQFLLEKLEDSDEYKQFLKENPDAYLCSGFFDIDLTNDSANKYHFDFYIPSNKKTFSFEMENEIRLIPLERDYDEKVLNKVLMKTNFDFDRIKEKIIIEMEVKKINNQIQKMIFSLQNIDGEDLLLGTVFLSGLGLLKVNIDFDKNQITDFEKKSIFDMIKVIKKNKDN
jgi:hypothetical protein